MICLLFLLSILLISQSAILLKGVSCFKKCVDYFKNENRNELATTFENVMGSLSCIHESIYENFNWEVGVNEGLIPLSEYLNKLSQSNDINNDDFKKYMRLASSNVQLSCQITGCIVQASQAGDSIINAGESIRLAGESLKDTVDSDASQLIVDAGESISIFGKNLLFGELK